MKLSDLKTFMMVETRDYSRYIVLRDIPQSSHYCNENNILMNSSGFIGFSNYTEDLYHRTSKSLDIVEVYCLKDLIYQFSQSYCFGDSRSRIEWDRKGYESIWMRKEEDDIRLLKESLHEDLMESLKEILPKMIDCAIDRKRLNI